jgi:hypothetical protein
LGSFQLGRALIGESHIAKSRVPAFLFFLEENPGHRDLQKQFFGRYVPGQNINIRPNGGGANDFLGGGESLLCFETLTKKNIFVLKLEI